MNDSRKDILEGVKLIEELIISHQFHLYLVFRTPLFFESIFYQHILTPIGSVSSNGCAVR